MAGGVTDAEEYWFVLCNCHGEGFRSPRVPIHRVISVLEKVRGFLID
jgi:hypothetical protein